MSGNNGLVILEGAISVLSALGSEYCEVTRVILRPGKDAPKILRAAKIRQVPVEYADPDGLASGKTHGGIIALAKKRRFLGPRELAARSRTLAVIEGIEDPYNLGYAVRALYTQGTDGLILPARDFGASESIIEKASTGTFYKMPAAVYSDKRELIKLLGQDFKIYCIDKGGRPIFDVKFAERSAFIIGGEKRGVSREFMQGADELVSLPYARAFPHSLAAQTAATIVAYEIFRQGRG